MAATSPVLVLAPAREELVANAAAWLTGHAQAALAARGRFRLLLAGGQTPRALYSLLAAADLDWPRWELWWGDERCVPPDHADSNFRMVREALIDPLAARGYTPGRIERWQAELPPAAAAALYDAALHTLAPDGEAPRFDVALLGMGADGHTASLFPHTPALDESERLAVANPLPGASTVRLTVTWPLLDAARQIGVLVAGADKAAMLAEVLHGPRLPQQLPAQHLLARADVTWFADSAAAERLP